MIGCSILVLLVVLFFAALGLYFFYAILSVVFYVVDPYTDIDFQNPQSIIALENFSGIKFSQNTVWHNACIYGFQDKIVMCKFSITSNDLQKMLADREVKWSKTVRYLQNNADLPWFTPDLIKDFKSIQIRDNDKVVSINILCENPHNNDKSLLLVYMVFTFH
jgi:hypothetical protein